YTAMLCVLALERHGVKPGDGEVLVTGATGGVGSVAIALLGRLGHRVVAATGKAAEADYLTGLGAAGIVDRAGLSPPGKPLQKERWAAVIDAVGSHTLANALAQTRYGGVVAACGLAQGADLPSTVMPFILRGATLAGVDSVMAPLALRQQAWQPHAAAVRALVRGRPDEPVPQRRRPAPERPRRPERVDLRLIGNRRRARLQLSRAACRGAAHGGGAARARRAPRRPRADLHADDPR